MRERRSLSCLYTVLCRQGARDASSNYESPSSNYESLSFQIKSHSLVGFHLLTDLSPSSLIRFNLQRFETNSNNSDYCDEILRAFASVPVTLTNGFRRERTNSARLERGGI